MADRAEKARNVNKGERKIVNKTPESDQPKQKKMVQLNLKSAPSPPPSVRNLVVSDKTLQKKRTSSSDQTPGDYSDFIVAIQESFAEIKDSMVKKDRYQRYCWRDNNWSET